MYYNLKIDDNMKKGFEMINVSLEKLLKDADIYHNSIQANNYHFTADEYKRLAESMDRNIPEDFILGISKLDSVATFNPEFFAGLCAENGASCINRISKYKKIVAPVNMKVVHEDDYISISYNYNDGDQLSKFMLFNAQVSILSIIRKGIGDESIVPIKVESAYAYPDNIVEYFGIKPVINLTDNKIVFSNYDLKRHFITENNRMWEYLEKELNQRLLEIETDQSFAANVRKVLFEILPAGRSDAESVSMELGVSKRSLQRKLKEENTSFNEQLNHTRELMVINYLKMDMSLDEIAFFVNYSDAKALSRAFKTWTGKSISEYKNSNIQ